MEFQDQASPITLRRGKERKPEILTTGLFWILRARLAYLRVFRVSSALISAGLMQAEQRKTGIIKDAQKNLKFKSNGCMQIKIINYNVLLSDGISLQKSEK